MIRWLLLLFLPFGVQATESPAVWQHWQYFRTVQLPATPSEWARITLPPDIHGPAQPNLADLRLVDRNGREIPYLLHAQHEQRQRSWRSVPLLDTGFTPGQSSTARRSSIAEAKALPIMRSKSLLSGRIFLPGQKYPPAMIASTGASFGKKRRFTASRTPDRMTARY